IQAVCYHRHAFGNSYYCSLASRQSFVYDVADIYKFETVVPIAFQIAGRAVKGKLVGDPVAETRRVCRNAFRSSNLLERLIPGIEEMLSAGGLPMPEDAPEAMPIAGSLRFGRAFMSGHIHARFVK